MIDLFSEIWESVRRNKLRTCLTGFAVSWGIFMLIVLLGAGRGLINSFQQQNGDYASNTMMVGGGRTSKPYDGLQQGRRIVLEDKDIELTLSKTFADNIDGVTATVGQSMTLSYGKRGLSVYVEGNYPSRMEVEKNKMVHGRFINQKDIDEKRKVIVIPENTVEKLMNNGRDAREILGKKIKVNSMVFTVVGITEAENNMFNDKAFAPFSTVKTVFNKGKNIDDLTFTFHGLESEEENEEFEKRYKAAVNVQHHAAPDDESATWIWNRFTQNLKINKASSMIDLALWIIGIFTLISGIVGVSNIMLITVKERIHEFGIRKALGATPWSVLKLIVSESVMITSLFGYIGMVLGLFVCEILDRTIGQSSMEVFGEQISLLKNPGVDLSVAVEATILLVVAGTLAGMIPARKASKVRPIEAIRAE